MESLLNFYNKNVRIIATNGKEFEGKIDEYIYCEDNENGNESIVMDDKLSGNLVEFYANDIKTIVIED